MKHWLGWFVGLAAACTYPEYNTYNQFFSDQDAGVGTVVAQGGSLGGEGGSGGPGAGGAAGSALMGAAGNVSIAAGPDCSGCVRLSIVSGRTAEYQLEFDSRRNLSTSLVLWRVRVRDYIGSVAIMGYVENGEHVDPDAANVGPGQPPPNLAVARTFVTLDPAAGWQDVGIDLQQVDAFRAPSFADAGGAAGASFDSGNPFDKSRVERVGLAITPFTQSGVFTPAILEVDALSFSNQQTLDFDFAAGTGDFELLDPESAVVTHVPE